MDYLYIQGLKIKNNKLNFWVIGIIIFFSYSLGMIIWTVVTAVSNPPQDENMYGVDYHFIDDNYNEIIDNQNLFNKIITIKTYQ